MSDAFLEFDEIGYWSEIKLEIIRDYASAYSRILNSKKLPHIYIDAFSGAGTHIAKSTGQFVPGSPTNALNVQPPFREYHFIDMDAVADAAGKDIEKPPFFYAEESQQNKFTCAEWNCFLGQLLETVPGATH